MNSHSTQIASPFQALPLIGTSSAFFVLMTVGFVIGSAGLMMMR